MRGQGVDQFWSQVEEYRRLQSANGRLAAKRQQQARAWMWERIEAGLRDAFRHHPAVKGRLAEVTTEVLQGQKVASAAARELLAVFQSRAETARC